jgi:NAD(P)-dependent dehydrogenase (short-subunit alcohol dehydrogenase family)
MAVLQRLSGKVAVVTGATSGIGLAIAQRFADEGAFVFVIGRDQARLQDAIAVLGDNSAAIQGDVANNADLDHIFEQLKNAKGAIDVLVANVGAAEFLPLHLVTEEHFDRVGTMNMRSVLFTTQKALSLFWDRQKKSWVE